MNSIIYKYELYPGFNQFLFLPGTEILTFQVQNDIPCIWVKQPIDYVEYREPESRVLEIVATGSTFDDTGYQYIGTAQQFGGQLVWHLFERLQEVSEAIV